MFFDNNIFYKYLCKLRDAGVNVPVVAGIMPVTNKAQIDRICRLSGTYLPSRFINIVDRFGGGDSFCAGLLFALHDSELSAPAMAIRFAVAASALKHTCHGDYNFSSRAEVESLMKGSASGRVQR
jgi:sugar/nucleoside kinase (ribokinase family)